MLHYFLMHILRMLAEYMHEQIVKHQASRYGTRLKVKLVKHHAGMTIRLSTLHNPLDLDLSFKTIRGEGLILPSISIQ